MQYHVRGVFVLGCLEAPKCHEAEPEKTSPELESKEQAEAEAHMRQAAKCEERVQSEHRSMASGKRVRRRVARPTNGCCGAKGVSIHGCLDCMIGSSYHAWAMACEDCWFEHEWYSHCFSPQEAAEDSNDKKWKLHQECCLCVDMQG